MEGTSCAQENHSKRQGDVKLTRYGLVVEEQRENNEMRLGFRSGLLLSQVMLSNLPYLPVMPAVRVSLEILAGGPMVSVLLRGPFLFLGHHTGYV